MKVINQAEKEVVILQAIIGIYRRMILFYVRCYERQFILQIIEIEIMKLNFIKLREEA